MVSFKDSICWRCELLEIESSGEYMCSKDISLLKHLFPFFPENCTSFILKETREDYNIVDCTHDHNAEANHDQLGVPGSLTGKKEYILSRDLSHLRKVRIGVPTQPRGPRDLDLTPEVLDWEDGDSDSEPQVTRMRPAKPFRPNWTIEDRRLFSSREFEMEGYCEECQNFGKLALSNGLYRCSTCLDSP